MFPRAGDSKDSSSDRWCGTEICRNLPKGGLPSGSAKVFFDGSNCHSNVGASIVPYAEETIVIEVRSICTDDLSQIKDQIYQDPACV